jgi:biopolymer transport protein ExbD
VNFKRGRIREELEINLIPLIDVLLVILIFLMVTTTYNRYSQLGVQLPQAQSASPAPAQSDLLEVTVARDGAITVAGKPLGASNQSELVAVFKAALQTHPQLTLQLAADAQTPHGRVVFVLDAARQAGITHLGIFTQSAAQP